MPMENLEDAVIDMLNSVQEGLYARAKRFMDENTHVTNDYGKFKAIIEEERSHICVVQAECEVSVKEETGPFIRCIR